MISKRVASSAALLGAAFLLLTVLSVASASATSPWWQVTTASRPTDFWLPESESEEQELKTELSFGAVFAAKVEVGGEVVGCLGSGAFLETADETCEKETSYSADETAAELEETLEGPYGAGNVKVTDGAAGGTPFKVETPGRWVPPVKLSVIVFVFEGEEFPLGTASTKILTGGSGRLVVIAENLGDAPLDGSTTPVTITDKLPTGVSAYHVADAVAGADVGGPSEPGPVSCTVETTSRVSCSFAGTLAPYEAIKVEIDASLTSTTPGTPGEVTVGGGNAPPASAAQEVNISEAETPFGVEKLSMQAEQEGGASATQAGSHPFQLTTTLQLNQGPLVAGGNQGVIEEQPLPRNFRFKLPAGLVGNATGMPRCSYRDFTTQPSGSYNLCPPDSAVGVASVTAIEPQNLGFHRLAVPVFNLLPSRGEPARFGFEVAKVPVVLDTAVRSGESYGVTVSVNNASEAAQLLESTVTLWGVPANPRHDESRGWSCVFATHPGVCAPPEDLQSKPFLRLPTSCGAPLGLSAELEPWNVPLRTEISGGSFPGVALDGCNREPFDPKIGIEPTTDAAETPSGLTVHLKVPQEASEAPNGISESDVRDTTVTLPPGLHVNPAAANGLGACSEAQVGFSHLDSSTGEAVFDESPAQCPEASKLGTVTITTPLLEEPVTGAVYQAAQTANPFGSLLALYVVADAPGSGIHVKLAGKVAPTESGQLVSTFKATPQLPFEEFELHFFGGAGAPLATSGCGAYATHTSIQPWSGGPAATPSSPPFQVTSGPNGAPCQDPMPFSPSFAAGTEIPIAGAYSPFVLRLGRDDGTQQITAIDTVLPPGLLGKLAGIPYCPEAAIAQAEGRRQPGEGALEQAGPSCPASSQVASVKVGAGAGPSPLFVQGKAYLAGPYKGAPLSLLIVTPAVAGPFDLGTVAVRTALHVNHETAQITAKSDPIPTILQGIPLDIRSIALRMDRPEFTLNPTSCEAMSVTGTAFSVLGQAAPLSNRFQVGACNALAFKPSLGLRLFGKTNRGAHPRLRAVLKMPKGNANIARAAVALPHSEFLDQGHIGTVCTRVQFAAGSTPGERCPAASIYGFAKAWSPLLDQPLQGPVYLRSSNHNLPDLVAALNGQIQIALDGRIDSVHGGIRNTFEVVPDAPVTKFILSMRGGRKGLLVNSRNICERTYRAVATFKGQNGRFKDLHPALKNSHCR